MGQNAWIVSLVLVGQTPASHLNVLQDPPVLCRPQSLQTAVLNSSTVDSHVERDEPDISLPLVRRPKDAAICARRNDVHRNSG